MICDRIRKKVKLLKSKISSLQFNQLEFFPYQITNIKSGLLIKCQENLCESGEMVLKEMFVPFIAIFSNIVRKKLWHDNGEGFFGQIYSRTARNA